MIWVLLQSESPWQRNNAIMFFYLSSCFSQKRSHRICSNFAIDEAIMAGTNSRNRFLKKTLVTEKHKDK